MAKQIEIRAASSKQGATGIKARFDAVKAQINSEKGGKTTDFDVIEYLLDAYDESQAPRAERSDSPLQKIRDAVSAQLRLNESSQAEKDGIHYEKRRITSAWVQSTTGANHAAIAQIIGKVSNGILSDGEMSDEINANHKAQGITETHNRKAPRKHKEAEPANYHGY